ncbi:glycosyltransferase [Sulfitobacter sp. SK012]|uniref:glycosyltransferase family protein n=1 Tax=Sulfitobacter sp. SK012 TaxID=1389005 RepID=UPI000E0BABAF|nr:glycosyltransferase [Sulfitobacter sp. SK012]AXI48042.1 glycosyltransferase [Sulfitobacter sp. SK012]
MHVMIVVTHLLGTGHLARALTLARAFKDAGDKVMVVSGGMPSQLLDRADVEIAQLPPLRSDGVDFATLLDADGQVASEPYKRDRQEALLGFFKAMKPDILITELFPFGRRSLRQEFEALLATAHNSSNRPLICASIRDILAPPSKPAKAGLADQIISTFYDAVLVHSDPAIAPLALSWPVSGDLEAKLHYTGFVAPAAAALHPMALGKGEIIVSAGGGDVGAHVYATAMEAAAMDPSQTWRLLVGGADPAARIAKLGPMPASVVAEPARPDFRQMLHHATASVSLCGYNTALDILQAGTPAVFVPFDAGGEVEQGLRAQALAQLDGIALLKNSDLTAASLLVAIERVLHASTRMPRSLGLDGATKTVHIAHKLRGAM